MPCYVFPFIYSLLFVRFIKSNQYVRYSLNQMTHVNINLTIIFVERLIV